MGSSVRTNRPGRRGNTPVVLLALAGITLAAIGISLGVAGPAQATEKPTSPAASTNPAAAGSAGDGFAAATYDSRTRVIIRATPGQLDSVLARVQQLDGTITRALPVINGFAATLPATAIPLLQADPQVLAITPDTTGHVQAINPTLGYDQTDTGSLDQITTLIGARTMWTAGYTGKGIDVALIDTGVSKVTGLTTGNLLNGPDLSTDQASTDLRYKDAYGHGTHMASLINGRDTVSTPTGYTTATSSYKGVAPDARVISLKVGATDGSADVSQVIAAIGWVTQHAHDPGLNIRVLNLSYGTTSTQDYTLDPLTYAVEAAWRNGITVIVAAGNDGTTNEDLANPAQDPNIIAVGAEDPNGTLTTTDDTIPGFSNRGTKKRHVDIVAPGTHILGLRVPGSVIDLANPQARIGTRFIRGSGTSQATAITSGAVALLLQARPNLTPNQVKWALSNSATDLPKGTTKNRGAGLINTSAALTAATTSTLPSHATLVKDAKYGTGTGTLELARGGSHLITGKTTINNNTNTTATTTEIQLTGEKDIFGTPWTATTWAPATLAATAWTGGSWRGNVWTGTGFNPNGDWANATWTAPSWAGANWTGRSWVGRSWVAGAWVGSSWVNTSWSGRTWVATSWSSSTWN